MRLEGQARLGYYPTPPAIARILAHACRPAHADQSWTVCDPFCGPGDALLAFDTPYRYGVELDEGRAAQAAAQSLTVISGNAFDVTLPAQSLSVLFLNPPYDWDPIANLRIELLALHTFVPAVKVHGLVFLIFPRTILSSLLTTAADLPLYPLGFYRFPDPNYDRFQQVILIAQRLSSTDHAKVSNTANNPWHVLRDTWFPYDTPQFPVLPETLDLPPVPATHPLSDTQFALRALRDDTLATFLAVDQRLAQTLTPLTTISAPLSAQDPIHTPMTLHRGHLATLLTAGRLIGAIGTGEQRHLVKGHIQQYRVQTSHRMTDTGYQETFETRYHVVLTTLHPDGQYKVWSPTDDDGIPITEDADDATAETA